MKKVTTERGINDYKVGRMNIPKTHTTVDRSYFYSLLSSVEELKAENKKLKNQLKKASSVIKFYADTAIGYKMDDGTYGMWVCSGELNWSNPLQSKTSMSYIHYDPRPAQNYLKKRC